MCLVRGDHLENIVLVDAHRLFREDVQIVFKCRNGDRCVVVMGDRNDDRFDQPGFHHVFRIGEVRNIVLFASLLCFFRNDIAARCQFHGGDVGNVNKVLAAHVAQPYNTDFYFAVAHPVSPEFWNKLTNRTFQKIHHPRRQVKPRSVFSWTFFRKGPGKAGVWRDKLS